MTRGEAVHAWKTEKCEGRKLRLIEAVTKDGVNIQCLAVQPNQLTA